MRLQFGYSHCRSYHRNEVCVWGLQMLLDDWDPEAWHWTLKTASGPVHLRNLLCNQWRPYNTVSSHLVGIATNSTEGSTT